MTAHYLKTWPLYFAEVASGRKNFEYRFQDRDFKIGDVLVLEEWNERLGLHTGRSIAKIITYILSWQDMNSITPGYCIMSLKDPEMPKP